MEWNFSAEGKLLETSGAKAFILLSGRSRWDVRCLMEGMETGSLKTVLEDEQARPGHVLTYKPYGNAKIREW